MTTNKPSRNAGRWDRSNRKQATPTALAAAYRRARDNRAPAELVVDARPCTCSHMTAGHQFVGEGPARRRGPCMHADAAGPCPCRQYAPATR